MRKRLSPLIASLAIILLSIGCGKANFRGDNSYRGALIPIEPAVDVSENQDRRDRPRPGGSLPDGSDPDRHNPDSPINNPKKEILSFKCSEGQDASMATIDYTGEPGIRVHAQIEGEFCPQSTNKLNVVFVVDFSSSMGRHRRPTYDLHSGYDPLIDGSCGRLRAVEAIYRKVQSLTKGSDTVRFGVVTYAGDILGNYTTANLVDRQQFSSLINADRLCGHVRQSQEFASNPGAISGSQGFLNGSVDPSTNYEAAFKRTASMLKNASGRNVVYFISDGEPTSPAANPIEAGTAAGLELREQVANLTVNGLLLGEPLESAFDVLRKVTGSNDRVLHADRASELDSRILEFPDAKIDAQTVSGRVMVEPYPEKTLGIAYLRPRSETVWEFQTQPFVLLGRAGETVANQVVVETKGLDGTTHSSIITVRYTQP